MITINKKSKITITQQIVIEFEERIRSGLMKANSKMPSIRVLSKELGVSAMTVVTAYENLEYKGFIHKIQGKGTFVSSLIAIDNQSSNQTAEDNTQNSPAHWQEEVQDYVKRSGYVQRVMMTEDTSVKSLGIAALHHRFLPTEEIFKAFSASPQTNYELLSKYPPIDGDGPFINEMLKYLRNKDVDANINNAIVTSGSQAAIHLVAETFIGNGDVVVVEAPSYPGAIDIFKNRGAIVIEVPMGQDGMRMDKLLTVCEQYPVKLVYTMPSHQNPTGITMELDNMQELLALSKEHGFIILEDDSWSDICFAKLERPIKGLDTDERVIYIAGISKVLGASFRISMIVCSTIFKGKLLAGKSNIDSGSPLLNQRLLMPYYNSLNYMQHMTWLRHELKHLSQKVRNRIVERFPSNVRISNPKGGLVFWLTFPYNFDCKKLYYYMLQEKKITFLLGENCYSSLRGKNQMRICYSYLEEDEVLECIDQIAEGVRYLML